LTKLKDLDKYLCMELKTKKKRLLRLYENFEKKVNRKGSIMKVKRQ